MRAKFVYDGMCDKHLASKSGQLVTVLRELGDAERDLEEVGRMFEVIFGDGSIGCVFQSELHQQKTIEEILAEAKERHERLAENRRVQKIKEGYRFYVYAPSSGGIKHDKVYFRDNESAVRWIKRFGKYMPTTEIFDLGTIHFRDDSYER
jgi:hypothetical protein